MSECKTFFTELEESSGGLSDKARAHVESCSACGEFLRESEALRQLVRGLEKVEAPVNFEFQLRARIAKQKGGRGRRIQLARFGPFSGYATFAAALCFVVISASLYFWQWQRRSPFETKQGSSSNALVISRNESTRPLSNIAPSPPTPTMIPTDIIERNPAQAAIHLYAYKLRGGARQHARETARVEEGQRNLENRSFAVSTSPVISRLRIPVSATAEPLRVLLRDGQGGAQVVPMRTVSFGSQEPLARGVSGQHASVKNEEGVW